MTTSIKTCFRCGESKPLAEFYRHKMMADGHLNKCKDCAKSDVRANRLEKLDQYRSYDRSRSSRPDRVAARERYQETEAGKVAVRRSRLSYQSRNPCKRAAHVMVGNAVRDGKLTKMPCETCGTIAGVHAHHDDYSKPLEVRWLCPVHHKQWHEENGEGKNGS